MPPDSTRPAASVVTALLPLMTVVLVAFLVIGVAIPVLPLHIRDGLGFGPFMVGLVTGSQFAVSFFARVWSGRTADARGAKLAVVAGLLAAAGSGLLYLLSLAVVGTPGISVSVLLAGRAVLGGAESFIITGAIAWGLSRVGVQNAGKVIAWMGTAMFTAFAGGAPLGAALYDRGGFAAIAWATAIAPLVTVLLIIPLRGALPSHRGSASILSVMRQVWLPGLSAAFSSIGFGAVIAFSSLLFVAQSWQPVWLAFTAYAVALIVARILFGHLPDRIGGAKVALVCLLIETGGLLLIGLAPSAGLAAAGAALAGFGYALVFPGLGVEAVRRAPPERQGLAMGAYTACLDLALGISGPVLGMIANHAGFAAAFLVSALLVLCGVAAGVPLLRRNPQP
jgi:MFS family permease